MPFLDPGGKKGAKKGEEIPRTPNRRGVVPVKKGYALNERGCVAWLGNSGAGRQGKKNDEA